MSLGNSRMRGFERRRARFSGTWKLLCILFYSINLHVCFLESQRYVRGMHWLPLIENALVFFFVHIHNESG